MNYRIVSCTKEKQLTQNDTRPLLPIEYSLRKLYLLNNQLSYNIHYENTEGIGIVYNKHLDQAKADGVDRLILVHDDVTILDMFMFEKLEAAFGQFDVVGVAGSTTFKLESPVCWHNAPKDTWTGAVEHPVVNKDYVSGFYMSSFGAMPKQTATIDGLFIGMNLKTIGDLRFRENYGFHFYDLGLALDANLKNLKVGVTNIYTSHNSHGGYNTPDWKEAEQKFINDFKRS